MNAQGEIQGVCRRVAGYNANQRYIVWIKESRSNERGIRTNRSRYIISIDEGLKENRGAAKKYTFFSREGQKVCNSKILKGYDTKNERHESRWDVIR